ncbi:MAG: acyl-CoA reductase [Bacteroidales bacterium]
MHLNERIEAFVTLGNRLQEYLIAPDELEGHWHQVALQAEMQNRWFTPDSTRFALEQVVHALSRASIEDWMASYSIPLQQERPVSVAVIMAGNVPLVGFHDFLSVLISGHKFLGKLSSKDQVLLKALIDELLIIEPRFAPFIQLEEERLSGFDAVIATGSNNTSRYFEYYFGHYPHIFRKNRNSAAVIAGDESSETMQKLGEDIFRYFGMGCRNVSHLFLPRNYCFEHLFDNLESFRDVSRNHKYANNYDYHRSLFLMNGIQHFDNGFLILREDASLASPVSVVHFQYYDDLTETKEFLTLHKDQLQCIVGVDDQWLNPGEAQRPKLWEYADNIDTMNFLLSLKKNPENPKKIVAE